MTAADIPSHADGSGGATSAAAVASDDDDGDRDDKDEDEDEDEGEDEDGGAATVSTTLMSGDGTKMLVWCQNKGTDPRTCTSDAVRRPTSLGPPSRVTTCSLSTSLAVYPWQSTPRRR